MRFVHVADAHLDTGFTGRSEDVRRRLREASRDAFRRAVDLAIREDVHAFLVAGDLFDGERLSFQTERFLLEQTARLGDNGITVVYATGNHDPGTAEAGPRPLRWPSCVRIAADGTPRRFMIHDPVGKGVGYVTTVGHATGDERNDLSRVLPRPAGELPEVALLHTQVHSSRGSDAHHPYAPSELTWLAHAGYDFWALGHVHLRQCLSEDPPIWYAGSLQGRTHAERGERGALLVDLTDRDAPMISFRPLAPVRWETIEVDRLDGVETLDELERHVQASWRAARAADQGGSGTEWMIRVVMRGPCPLWSELRTEEDRDVLARELREMLGGLDVAIVADEVHPVVPVDEHRNRTDILGEVLRMAERLRRGDDAIPVDRGDLVGLASDDPAAITAYVRTLLDGAEGEIASRLLEG
jgi:hypothetical protein